jgi:hypothetical protein
MANNKQHLTLQLSKMLSWKRSNKFYAEKLGVSEADVLEMIKELKPKQYKKIVNEIKKVNNEKGTIESTLETSFEPKSDLELAKLHRIDLTKYKISTYWSKLQTNGNFTSSVFASLKKPNEYSPEDLVAFLKKFTPKSVKEFKNLNDKTKENIDAELSIADYHLAKKVVEGCNDPAQRAITYYNIAENLVHKTRLIYNIDKLVFPISNDFFHTDNYANQTTNLTPQDTIMSYSDEYELGFALLVDTINMLKANATTVHVVLVQGNHDRTKSYYLAHALEIYFKECANVTFDRSHSVIKGVTLGNTFIGYHHGNCKIDDLPLLFATSPSFSTQFGTSQYREVHTGDKHHYMAKDIKGVRIQQMPSLSGADRWHADHNFVNSVRAALMLHYNYRDGKIGEFEARI